MIFDFGDNSLSRQRFNVKPTNIIETLALARTSLTSINDFLVHLHDNVGWGFYEHRSWIYLSRCFALLYGIRFLFVKNAYIHVEECSRSWMMTHGLSCISLNLQTTGFVLKFRVPMWSLYQHRWYFNWNHCTSNIALRTLYCSFVSIHNRLKTIYLVPQDCREHFESKFVWFNLEPFIYIGSVIILGMYLLARSSIG